MKYCSKCGKENIDFDYRCISCGEVLPKSKTVSEAYEQKKTERKGVNNETDLFPLYALIITMALLIIIRLFFTQEIGYTETWRGDYMPEYSVPENIKGVMMVITAAFAIICAARPSKVKGAAQSIASLGCIIMGIIGGLIITFKIF